MTPATDRPLKPITPAQLKALHAIGRRRGMSHEQLRDVARVDSLKDLSVTQAAALIDRMQTDEHRKDWQPGEPRRTARGAIRNASERQRTYIQTLIDELGWDADKAAAWLDERHGIKDLAGGVFSTKVASEAIIQLEHARQKHRGTAADRSGIDGA